MKEKTIIVGIDVSKATLDICLLSEQKTEMHQVQNNPKRIRSFFNKLLKHQPESKVMVCMENTGYYNWPSYAILAELQLCLFVVHPLHLKRSMGLTRGKNDAIDAVRIAQYLSLHHSHIKPTCIPRKEIRTIQSLLAQRNRLVEAKKKFSVPTQELVYMADKTLSKEIQKSSQRLIKEIEKQILHVEKQLDKLIDADDELYRQYQYLTSVQGVGKVLAWTLLVKTNEFKAINDARKLACYAGVVPFEFQSGTSVHKKPRVSYMADKTLKKLLHLAAMRAIRLKGDLQNYYQRKVDDGKNKMLVLNAIRNKLVARICSVIRNQKSYQIDLFLS